MKNMSSYENLINVDFYLYAYRGPMCVGGNLSREVS